MQPVKGFMNQFFREWPEQASYHDNKIPRERKFLQKTMTVIHGGGPGSCYITPVNLKGTSNGNTTANAFLVFDVT